jgi:uncharacterized membrane protein
MNGQAGDAQIAIGDLLKDSWEIFKENVGLLLGGLLILIVVNVGANSLTWGIAGMVIGGPLMLGYLTIVMKLIRKQPAEFGMVFSGFQRFLPAFLANLLITIFSGIGLILCIVPGLFVGVIYMFTFYFMVDREGDFWPIMEASREKVMGNLGQWVILFLALLALNIVGAIPCGLGLLVTAPMSAVALGLAYDRTESVAASSAMDMPVEPDIPTETE